MGMKYGYARVSTSGQELDSQLRALKQAGCEKIVSEVASGALRSRPQLDELLSQLVAGDTLVVYRLDRLGRSLQHLIGLLSDLTSTGVHFISLSEAIDTTTAQGRLMMAMTAALAEFERDLIRERTIAGLEAAHAAGRKGGRPTKLTPATKTVIQTEHANGTTVTQLAKDYGVSRSTINRAPKEPTNA